jgi:dolichol-phosphate mannosyltransferase
MEERNRLISVVSPVYNESRNVGSLLKRLRAVAADENRYDWEFIYVDDGSTDDTAGVLGAESERDSRVKLVQLTRNFGHQLAITAGLNAAGGDAVITMDGDLQHPPETLPEFLRRWEAGAEVVVGLRDSTKAGRFKGWTSRLFYWLINKFSDVPIMPGAADFRLMSRRAVDQFLQLPERARFIRGLVSWIGINVSTVNYVEGSRTSGASKYSVSRMLFLAVDAITSFSALPLRVATVVGLLICLGAVVYAAYILVAFVFFPEVIVPGWTSIILLVLFLGGIQLLFLGVVGEYLHRIFDEVKQRPLYMVKRTVGFETAEAASNGKLTEITSARMSRFRGLH